MNYDHCPKCGEYLNDEMGHVCPVREYKLTARDRYILDQLYEHGSTLQIQNGETIGIPLRKAENQ